MVLGVGFRVRHHGVRSHPNHVIQQGCSCNHRVYLVKHSVWVYFYFVCFCCGVGVCVYVLCSFVCLSSVL